jgi:GDP-D-mannose dehydratase
MLDMLLALSPAKISVHQDATRLQPSDVPILWADGTKSRTQTGWEPNSLLRRRWPICGGIGVER